MIATLAAILIIPFIMLFLALLGIYGIGLAMEYNGEDYHE